MKKRTRLIQGFSALERIFKRPSDLSVAPQYAIIEAQRTVFRTLHRRFLDQAKRGECGIEAALDALDSIWASVRNLSDAAPFVVETLSTQNPPIQHRLQDFYQESTKLLEDGIRAVFADQMHLLRVPPQRMAKLIRIFLEGLLMELVQAQNDEQLAQLDQAYADIRTLFRNFVLQPSVLQQEESQKQDIVLPW